MAQRLLAAKSERDAQKALLIMGALSQIYCFAGFVTGAVMRANMPGIHPDESFIQVLMTMFPVGVKGLLIAGFMAALLSTADGLLTASGLLFSEDIYLRFMRPHSENRERKLINRIVQACTLAIAIALFPFVVKSASVMTFLQNFYGDVLGVVVALYLVGIFSCRTTANAAFFSMISGIFIAISLDIFTPLNFAYVGFFSFMYAAIATVAFSYLDKPRSRELLTNLTVHTLPDVRGPWVGLAAWPALWKWALFLALCWFAVGVIWEWYIG
jgi:solute:Na+ symporter, SSS family